MDNFQDFLTLLAAVERIKELTRERDAAYERINDLEDALAEYEHQADRSNRARRIAFAVDHIIDYRKHEAH